MFKKHSAFWSRPSTRPGRWAVWAMLAFYLLFFINMLIFILSAENISWWRAHLLPVYAVIMLLSGLLAGILAIIALFRKQERSWAAWLSLVTGVLVLALVVSELLQGLAVIFP